MNDYFVIDGLSNDLYPNNRLVIFNRWGSKVFEKDDYQNDWDGDYMDSGKNLPDGTLTYYMLYLDKNKTSKDDIYLGL